MKKLMNLLFLSCKKATELIEKREITPLSGMEKIQLKLHTSMCNACKSYEKQSHTLDSALSIFLKKGDISSEEKKLSVDKKSEILKRIKEK